MEQRIIEKNNKITTKQYEKSSEMYLKIISQSTPPHFAVYFTRSWVCRSTLQHLHSGQISRKLWRAPCRKPFSNTLWDVSKNIFAIRTPYFVVYIPEFGCHIRYGNLILILVKVPQIVTYILQKAFLICSGNIERTGKA